MGNIKAHTRSVHNGIKSRTGRTQDWSIGNTVKVGFLTFTVTGFDGRAYSLVNAKGIRYEFVAHEGLNRLYDHDFSS